MPLWSGRFDEAPNARTLRFGASFEFDRLLLDEDVSGSLAWVEALARAGAITSADAATLTRGLETLRARAADPAYLEGDDEDVHTFVERKLTELVGEVGARLHTGRSRNEQVALDLRLFAKRRIGELGEAVRELIAALLLQAERAGGAVMPAYTHLRRAQPVLAAHYWLSTVPALRRDLERLDRAYMAADVLPLGSGAIAGSNYPLDIEFLAARLGFGRIASNSIDAVADRDFVIELAAAAAVGMTHLSRLAEDLILFSSEEFGFVELADAVATGSSLMPQKKNPDPLELVRGKTGRVAGHLVGLLVTMKGTPSGYNRDFQEDKEGVFDAIATWRASLGVMAEVVRTLEPRVAKMEAAAEGLLMATDVADYLVARGLPFRRAHELVGQMSRRLSQEGRGFASLSLAEWKRWSVAFDNDIVERVGPHQSVRLKSTPAGTGPAQVRQQLAEIKAWLAGVEARPATSLETQREPGAGWSATGSEPSGRSSLDAGASRVKPGSRVRFVADIEGDGWRLATAGRSATVVADPHDGRLAYAFDAPVGGWSDDRLGVAAGCGLYCTEQDPIELL